MPESMELASWSRYEPLAPWAARHAIAEAYRVRAEPSSHGLHVGWQVTVWRSGRGWLADRQVLRYFSPAVGSVAAGSRLSRRRADGVLRAIDAAAFWDDGEWPRKLGADGYTVFYEGWRGRVARVRSVWCPGPLDEPAWELTRAFDAIRPWRILWWRRVPVHG
jgi:hypothetical protein